MSPTGSLLLVLLALGFATTAQAAEPIPEVAPRLFVGAAVGAALPLAGLGPSVAPSLEAGGALDAGGRFSPFVLFGYSGGQASGTGQDPGFPDGYHWKVAVDTALLQAGLRFRVLPWGERLSPEVAIGPVLGIGETRVSGSADGEVFPQASEARVSAGGFASAGLVGRVGPGMLEGRVTFSMTRLDGDLTGDVWLPTVTPAIGYRVSR